MTSLKLPSIIFLFFYFTGFAQSPVILSDENKIYEIGRNLAWLPDTGNIDVAILLKGKYDNRFVAVQQDAPNFAYSYYSAWFRFEILNQTDKDWILELAYPILDRIELYEINDSLPAARIAGDRFTFDKREIRHKDFLFTLTLDKAERRTFYMKVQGNPLQFPIRLSTSPVFIEKDHRYDMFHGFYYGTLLVMIFYNLFLFFSIREKSYLYYVLYVLNFILLQAGLQGYGYEFLWPQSPAVEDQMRIFGFLSGISIIYFSKSFLNIPDSLPGINKGLNWLVVFTLISVVISLSGNARLASILLQLNSLITVLMAIVISFYLMQKGFRPARFFVIAFLIFFIGIIIYTLKNFGILPRNNFTEYTMQFGSGLEVILLSFALGDKINLIKKEKENLIRDQNRMLEEKVEKRTVELKTQKRIIEEKNKNITDSINYANRIQLSILPSEDYLASLLKEYFIVFKPKDIVSGDIYWVEEVENEKKEKLILIAAIDCTGHGVPGALMSIVANNLLNHAVKDQKLYSPAAILDSMGTGLSETLKGSSLGIRSTDGMDIALCAVNHSAGTLTFSGAQSSILVVTEKKLTEYKGNKFPIEGTRGNERTPFNSYEIPVAKTDMVYLFSDGYGDQFGGPKGKKFMNSPFKNMLADISDLSAIRQKEIVDYAFEDWKGNEEQVDDVLVMGFRV
jgi:two-component system, sensor histidine kinase LadS